jgi:hypothetical protein
MRARTSRRLVPWLILLAMVLGASSLAEPASAIPAPSTMERPGDRADDLGQESDGITQSEGLGGAHNIVTVLNRTDNRLRVRGNVQLDRGMGGREQPVNISLAYSSCTDCQSIAVALQIALRAPDAQIVAPQNAALAFNVKCTRCHTVALAFQYVYAVDDPSILPDEASSLIREMDRELQIIHSEPRIGLQEAEVRVISVVNRFNQFALSIDVKRDEKDESVEDEPVYAPPEAAVTPTATPTPELAATPTFTPMPSLGQDTQPTATPTVTTDSVTNPASTESSATATATATSTPFEAPPP